MAGEKEPLGHVDVTSGTIFVFDFGLIEAIEAAGSAKAAVVSCNPAPDHLRSDSGGLPTAWGSSR
jgi:hypothetical protein